MDFSGEQGSVAEALECLILKIIQEHEKNSLKRLIAQWNDAGLELKQAQQLIQLLIPYYVDQMDARAKS